MILGTSGVICGNLGTFWSNFSDFRMQNQNQNHTVILHISIQDPETQKWPPKAPMQWSPGKPKLTFIILVQSNNDH